MILIIDNYDSFTYNLYQCIAPFYKNIRIIRNDKISVNEIRQLKPKGIILSPGPKHPEEAGICIDLIQNTQDTPLLGVCLGHQAIAMAFGGKVVQAPEIIHGKKDFILHNKTSLFQNMSMPFEAGRYHSLIVERASLPNVLNIEAENEQQIIMGLKHKTLPIYGVQFHPESILTPEGSVLLEAFVQLCI
jgi:anthranilate synthase component 2